MTASVLVANRGEVALRILRAAADLGLRTIAVYGEEDADARHVRVADQTVALNRSGVQAYLDIDRLLDAAVEADADLLHPGYGFVSENPKLAAACAERGVSFVGPSPDVLELFGDKLAARLLAREHDVAVLDGSEGPVDVDDVIAFLQTHGRAMVKAVAGGGGRGMRLLTGADPDRVAAVVERARSEARTATGDDRLYVEVALRGARHLEVQILGDGEAVVHLGERDCSLQRRHQKLIEITPAIDLAEQTRERLTDAATRLASAVGYAGAGTVEFLVGDDGVPQFLEVNPRLQVEHTVTEEITGIDLVAAQLRIALGERLADLGLTAPPDRRGTAIQLRINAETVDPDGTVHPSAGTVETFDPPTGPGVRVDSAMESGGRLHPAFDSLVAKVVVHGPDADVTLRRARRALTELRVDGVDTNVALLGAILDRSEVATGDVSTRFVDDHLAELFQAVDRQPRSPMREARGAIAVPTQGTVVAVPVTAGDDVVVGATVAVIEAMKMEHEVRAPVTGVVRRIDVEPGQTVQSGQVIGSVDETDAPTGEETAEEDIDLDDIRDDLAAVLERHAATLDENRPEAVAKRRERDQRTPRENIADLCDPGTFVEYGALVVAAQRERRDLDELIEKTPADGLVAGLGRVNGELFGDDRSRCAVLSYDATVLAGTQGHRNHQKKDRIFELVARTDLPVVLFAEGGGGRPGDTDTDVVTGLQTRAFELFAGLRGRVPLIGIASRYCFAGNAALLGCCDVIIATRDSNIGMGGPAMIEGGGLGSYEPDEIGPVGVQSRNGVVDIVVENESEAVTVTRRVLSYAQGELSDWSCSDQRVLRHLIPENRRRVYDIREVLEAFADVDSVQELRPRFAPGIVTAFARLEGRPIGIIANDPTHLGGAVDHLGAEKTADFLGLCEKFGIPVVSLIDTPGFMVGPDAEAEGLVRAASRLFVAGANLTVPLVAIILRKGYGLGAQAMACGSFHAPLLTVAWPSGEMGGMNLEGAVRLGFRRELEAIDDPDEREQAFEEMVDLAYDHGKALNVATHFEIDDVIDPADSRPIVANVLRSARRHGGSVSGHS